MKPKLTCILLLTLLLCTGCSSAGLPAEVWVDYFQTDDMPWEESRNLTLPEFPGVTFTWTSDGVIAGDGKETVTLFTGMPVWNVYLCDLTGDGKPEFCATVSWGSGIVDTHVIVYDYASNTSYSLVDRGFYDYALIGEGTSIWMVKSQYPYILREENEAPEKGIPSLAPDGGGSLQLVMEH